MSDTTIAWLIEAKQRFIDERALAVEMGVPPETLALMDQGIAALTDAIARLSVLAEPREDDPCEPEYAAVCLGCGSPKGDPCVCAPGDPPQETP